MPQRKGWVPESRDLCHVGVNTSGSTEAAVRLATAIAFVVSVLVSSTVRADRVTTGPAVKTAVTVRQKGSVHSKAMGALLKNHSAELIGTTKAWQRVRLDDGIEGYVSAAWTRVVHEGANLAAADPLVVTFVDVGQGDAILLQLGDVDVLVDTGRSPRGTRIFARASLPFTGPRDALHLTGQFTLIQNWSPSLPAGSESSSR